MNVYHLVIDSPIGPLGLEADDTALLKLTFGAAPADSKDERRSPILRAARTQLSEYFAGARRVFDLPLRPLGTDFQLRVWNALRTIPYGEQWSYGRLAAVVGVPKAARAVGGANNRNPLAIVIPCHRVVGHDGKLVGFGGGLLRKAALLELESPSIDPRRASANLETLWLPQSDPMPSAV